jgi:hypothetical protein
MISEQWRTVLLATVFLGFSALCFVLFIEGHEAANRGTGWTFDDPFFRFLPAMDLSFPIFSLTYGTLLFYLFTNYKKPFFLSRLMVAYGLIVLFKIATISMLPLREPDTLVHLNDPFLNNLIYPGEIVTDLFFSGHTALIFLYYFLADRRIYFLILAILMGLLVMIQRVHYSIDVLAAFPFSWVAVSLSNFAITNLTKRNNQ